MTAAEGPELRGIAWDHPRAMQPLHALAASLAARPGEARVTWDARSLQAFADASIADLAERFDLLVIDHPWVGRVAADGSLLALDEHLDARALSEARDTVGGSHASYTYDGHQWALAIDAAAQVAALRPDLHPGPAPATWDEVLELAREVRRAGRWVAVPLKPVDALMAFFSLCVSLGRPAFPDDERAADRDTGLAALDLLTQLLAAAHPAALEENPIQVLDRLANDNDVVYSPLLFGYTNYARAGFAPQRVRFAPAPSHDGRPLGSVLGGTGIAVSACTSHPREACAIAALLASGTLQSGDYVRHGGQPAHVRAWDDAAADALCGGFFSGTRPTMDAAWLRPRYDGFLDVQDAGGLLVHQHLRGELAAADALDGLDALHARARRAARC